MAVLPSCHGTYRITGYMREIRRMLLSCFHVFNRCHLLLFRHLVEELSMGVNCAKIHTSQNMKALPDTGCIIVQKSEFRSPAFQMSFKNASITLTDPKERYSSAISSELSTVC